MASYVKDPAEVLDFAVDWSRWLPDGDAITDVAWTVPDGVTQPVGLTPTVVDGKATIWLSGGAAGQTYPIVCRITTVAGRVSERTITITVRDL